MRRKRPDWRYHPPAVLRDVRPGCVVVRITVAGKSWRDLDFPADLIARVETLARERRRTFGWAFLQLATAAMEKYEREF